MGVIERRHTGACNELMATCWLLRQGYEVFRNVSPHGPIDIIARRGSETLLIDVKSATKGSRVRITDEQAAAGVVVLVIDPDDGRCELDMNPLTIGGLHAPRICAGCGSEYRSRDAKQMHCSKACRPSAYVSKKLKSV